MKEWSLLIWLPQFGISVVFPLIGFVMLSGIIVNNGIVLVDYTNQLRAGGMEKRKAIIDALKHFKMI